ncbi:MAG: right-handed parallel beta-helix repeat-containing protein [Candidatus Heimdallarchaeota archaeon]|nr:MAG: right-handed parallel beta-helix repeat-containing protein [Candidatus Heimdallarchaeota archaeon]
MKRPKILLLFVLTIVLTYYLNIYKSDNNTPFSLRDSLPGIIAQVYTLHSPITITMNDHFAIYDFPGTGTLDDPYRIEHLNITASSGALIHISDTTVYFWINNNSLDGLSTASAGIYLSNVHHAFINGNVILNAEDGIHATAISDSLFHNNSISSNLRFGIFLDVSTNCSVSNNRVHDNGINGVHMKDTDNTTISQNILYNHQLGSFSQCGLLLDNSSTNQLVNNSIFENYFGIKLLNSAQNNLLTNNTIYGNQKQGIHLEYASKNMIMHNTLLNNLLYGVQLTVGSNDNVLQYNNFTGNNGGGIQAFNVGVRNTFLGNYWDDWASKDDANDDLIIDTPYLIDGRANNSDLYPLVVLSVQAINNIDKGRPDYSGIFLFFVVVLVGITASMGGGYFLYVSRFKEPVVEEPFTDFTSADQIDRIKPLYHKIVVGLENIQAAALPEPAPVPLLKPAETITLVEFFPADIKKDLRSGLRWRTILTLIEIAYQDPTDTNPAQLAQSMEIPRSTLSKEIKRLTDLHYIESFISDKVLRDARFRNYAITPKGFKLLFILKEAFKLAISRLKEKQEVFYG